MNAQRLVTLVEVLQGDFQTASMVSGLTQLQTAVQSAIDGPNETTQRAAETAFQLLLKALRAAPSNLLSPGLRENLGELSVEGTPVVELVGNGLADNLARIFADGSSTSIQTLDGVRKYLKLITVLNSALDSVQSGLTNLGVGRETLQPGESVVGMTIPRSEVDDGFRSLLKELRFFDQLLTTLSEALDGTSAEPQVHSLRSSNFGIDVNTTLQVASAVGVILTGVTKIMELAKAYRELKKTAETLGVDPKLAGQLGHQGDTAVETAIDAIEAEVFQHSKVDDHGRLNEHKTAVRLKINGLVNRVERGFTFEVRTELPPQPTPADEELAQPIVALSSIRFEPISGPRLLELPEGEDVEPAAQKETGRAVKKKKP